MNNAEVIQLFWDSFISATNKDTSLNFVDCYHFDITEEWANKLLGLVLAGTKKATSSSLYSYEWQGAALPKIGDLNIVTDWDGNPQCVIETTNVTILPFRDMTFEICKREGEDDSLESWQEGHIHFFTEDGKTEGYQFTWDMPVVFEDFEVIYRNNQSNI